MAISYPSRKPRLPRCDPLNGYDLDRTQSIVNTYKELIDLEDYFDTKEDAIRERIEIDVATAEKDGIPERVIRQWKKDSDEMLVELEGQRKDAMILAGF